jgi:hypothetical protein
LWGAVNAPALLSPMPRIILIAFLDSLTDAEFLNNPSLSDPWKH